MSLRRPTAALLFLHFPLEESFRHSFGTQYFILVYFYPYVCIMVSRIFSWRMYDRLLNLEYVGYIIPVFLMFASTFKRTHWLVPGYCLGQIPCLEISIAVTTSEPMHWRLQPREDRSYPGQLFLWEMESHRRRCTQSLPPSTTSKPNVVLPALNGLVLHIFVPCLEFLYQVGTSSANSNPGAGEHTCLFLGIYIPKIRSWQTWYQSQADHWLILS